MLRISRHAVSVLAVTAGLLAGTSGSAVAKPFPVVSGKTTITLSAGPARFLAKHHVSVTPLGAASIQGDSLTLPVTGGRVSKSAKSGVLVQQGGVEFSNGRRSVDVRGFVLVGHNTTGRLTAVVDGRRIVLARLIDITRTVSGRSGTISAKLTLSARVAELIDRRLGRRLVTAGTELGTLTSSVTVS